MDKVLKKYENMTKVNYIMKLLKILIAILFISCSSSQAQNKTKHIPVHKYQPAVPGKIIAPANYKPERPLSQSFINSNLEINLFARNFVRGDAIYFEVIQKNKITDLQIRVNDKEIFASKRNWGYRGLFTIHPENEERDVKIDLAYNVSNSSLSDIFKFQLDEKNFPVSKSSLDIGKYSRADIQAQKDIQDRIKTEYQEKLDIFKNVDPDHLGSSFAHPRNNHVTSSPFYIKRIYEQYKYEQGKKITLKPKISYHRGFDFRAKTGDPVFSMAAGKVVIAKDLHFEGNCVMLDHGNKVFTMYMHLSKLNVYKGQLLKPGHLIGYVGSTGVSTGPHLHVSLFINSVPTDPMSLIVLPIRN